MNRNEKIKFLTDLQTGKKLISELQPAGVIMIYNVNTPDEFVHAETGRKYNRAQLDQILEKNITVICLPDNGRDIY